MCSFHQLVDELLVKVSLYLFIFLILFPVSGGMYYTTHSEHFLSLAVDFCRTSESSCRVKIPVLQDDQLLDKHYIFLCTDHTSTHFKKDFDWQDLAEAIPCFSKKKCCSDPPTAPFRFKTLFPQLQGVLTVDSSGLMIPQLKTATWTRAKPPFWGKFPQPITGQCWSIKSWMDFLIDHPNSRGESTEVFVVTASLPECSFFPVLSFSFSYRYFFFFNRRIIALQCYVGFCHATIWISHACTLSCSVVSDSLRHRDQAPLSMGFSRQEYWIGLPCPPPGDLSDPRIKPVAPGLTSSFFTIEPPGKPMSIPTSSPSRTSAHPTPPYPSRLSQSTRLSSLCYTAASH